ncbi:MAG: histidine phosphatase family protein [Ruminococcaceae bacterium]|nr:histidine phosphatase family protein [Oscillospiraceae bacterium]
MSMTIILLRHAESGKNVKNSFSSAEMDNNEVLTQNGIEQASCMGDSILNYCKKNNIKNINVYSAKSLRSLQTAEIISRKLNCTFKSIDGVKSFNFGTNAGQKEIDVKREQSKFYHDLTLYRKGVVNSYDIIYEGSKETLKNYESYVCDSINLFIDKMKENELSIFIIHRSAITAYLLFLARKYLNYPEEFYGYIQLDLGGICIFKLKNGELEYLDVNLTTDEFMNDFL